MKIPIINGIKTSLGITALAGTIMLAMPKQRIHAHTPAKQDSFEYVEKQKTITKTLPPTSGSNNFAILRNAPNPTVTVKGEKKKATIVVDISKNVLYHYDKNGKPTSAYLVASGKPQSPTKEIVSIVSHVETYPYKSAPTSTKRYKSPKSFGPKALILNKLDTITGEQISSGQFIHGNNNFSSLGKYESGGCIRMDNEVIKEIAKKVKHGDIVIFRKIKIK